VRYGCVRRQGWRTGQRSEGGREVTLMDYQTHQARLFPVVAHAIALHFTAKAVAHTVSSLVHALASPSPSTSLSDALESVHATTCGLKAFATWYVNDSLEVCRQSLGGQGYSAYSLLPRIRNDWAVMCTWEGDNTVLALQCAKHCIRRATDPPLHSGRMDGEDDPFDYLRQAEEEKDSGDVTLERLSSPAGMVGLFRLRAQWSMRALLGIERSPSKLLESSASACVEVARAHCDLFVLRQFAAAVEAAPAELRAALTELLLLSASTQLLASSSFLPASPLPASAYGTVAALQSSLLSRIRPVAVPLTDAFALPDFVLGPLGRRDGEVYNALYEAVRRSGQRENGKAQYWDEFIQPLVREAEGGGGGRGGGSGGAG
jgi:acyl-CoA oxidase